MPNGNLIRHSSLPGVRPSFGGQAGLFEEFDWNGKKVWEYKCYIPDEEVSHHTFEVMPNGNLLILVWKKYSYEDALAKGLKPDAPGRYLFREGLKDGKQVIEGIWPDVVREIEHGTGRVVWEWAVWDHIGTGPDQIDINKFVPRIRHAWAGPDWTHFNGVAYNPATNEIAITSRNLAEVYVIDYGSDKGIKYRWGNPANYGKGAAPAGYADDGDQKLFGPHAPDWTAEGTISIMDNGHTRPSGNYTRAVELDPKKNAVVWQWKASDVRTWDWNFYSQTQSGAQKLPNGNWMLTTSNDGHVIEVTNEKDIVWEFTNPIRGDKVYAASNQHGKAGNSIHKALRYPADFPGFQGKKMKNEGKLPNWTSVLSKDQVELPKKEAPAAPVKTYKRVVPAAE